MLINMIKCQKCGNLYHFGVHGLGNCPHCSEFKERRRLSKGKPNIVLPEWTEYVLTDEDYEIIINALETVRPMAYGFDVDDIDRVLSKVSHYRSSVRKPRMAETEYSKIIMKALKQIEYDIYCLGDEEILVLNRLIHGYLVSQGMFSEFKENSENRPLEEKTN